MTNPPPPHRDLNIVLLGGNGQLARGLSRVLAPDKLTVIASTADYFTQLGLHFYPTIDALLLALAQKKPSQPPTQATWQALEQIGGPTWFPLDDQTLALQLLRAHWLSQGYPLTWVTLQLCRRYGVEATLLPMTDSPVSITAHTSEGKLTLEDYLWRRQAAPQVQRFEYEGFEQAEQNRDILRAIRLADVIIFAPVNPLLTLNPILSLPGLARLIGAASAPKIAVSPIVNGRDLQGNLDKMMGELGLEVSPFGVAEHIKEVLNGFVLDINDQMHQLRIYNLGLETLVTNTIINQADDEVRLANEILDFGESLR